MIHIRPENLRTEGGQTPGGLRQMNREAIMRRP